MSGFTRRQFVQKGGLATFGLALTTFASGRAEAALPRTLPGAAPWAAAPLSAALRAPADVVVPYVPVGPQVLTATHSLSEDAFLTSDVVVDLNANAQTGMPDRIVPITRGNGPVIRGNGGNVEALVLSQTDNRIYHLSRDPTTSSGWSYRSLASGDSDIAITDMAAQLHPTDGRVYIVYREVQGNDQNNSYLSVGFLDTNNYWGRVDPPSNQFDHQRNQTSTTPIQSGIDGTGTPYFYLWNDPSVFWWVSITPGDNPSSAIGQTTIPQAWTESNGIEAKTVVQGTITMVNGWAGLACVDVHGQTITTMGAGRIDALGSVLTTDLHPPGQSTTLLWAGQLTTSDVANSPGEQLFLPGAAYAAPEAAGGLLVRASSPSGPGLAPVSFSAAGGMEPSSLIMRSNAFVSQAYYVIPDDSGGNTLYTQILGPVKTSMNNGTPFPWAPIPLGIDVAAVFAPSVLNLDPTFFSVSAIDQTLRVHVRSTGATSTFYSSNANGLAAPYNPADGAYQVIPVQGGSATSQQIDTWRTSLQLTDSFGYPIAGEVLTVTVDRDVQIWQPGGFTQLTGGDPQGFSFTTDIDGVITLAAPAVGLSTATYTVSTTDNQQFVLYPDGDVHAVLANTDGTLIAQMNAATAPDGSPLFGSIDATTGAQLTDFTSTAIAAGSTAAAVLKSLTAAQRAEMMTLNAGSLTGWWDRAKHDAESALHAIEQGIVTVATDVELNVAATCTTLENGLTQVALTLGGLVDDVITYVITDIKSAISAVAGALLTFVKDIKNGLTNVIHWLKTHLFAFFEAVNTAADAMLALLVGDPNDATDDCASARMLAEISLWETRLNGDISSWKVTATDQIAALQTHLSGQTLTGLKSVNVGPSAMAGPVTYPPPVGGSPLQPLADVVHDVKANWLRDKVKNQPAQGSPDNSGVNAAFENFGQLLVDALGAVGGDVKVLADAVYDIVKGGVGPSQRQGLAAGFDLSALFDALTSLVDDFFQLMEVLLDGALDLLSAAVQAMVELFKTDVTSFFPILNILPGLSSLTVGKLVCLLIAFPGTVYAQLRWKSDQATMFTTSPPAVGDEAVAALDDPTGTDYSDFLTTGNMMATFFWGAVDGTVDIFRLVAQAEGETYTPPPVIGWMDIGFATFANTMQYPFQSTVVPDGGSLSFEPKTSPTNGTLPMAAWGVGFIPPAISLLTTIVTSKANKGVGDEFSSYASYFTCFTGLAATVMNWQLADDTDITPGDQEAARTIAFSSNCTNLLATIGEFTDETDGVTAIVKAVFDIACPIITFGAQLAVAAGD